MQHPAPVRGDRARPTGRDRRRHRRDPHLRRARRTRQPPRARAARCGSADRRPHRDRARQPARDVRRAVGRDGLRPLRHAGQLAPRARRGGVHRRRLRRRARSSSPPTPPTRSPASGGEARALRLALGRAARPASTTSRTRSPRSRPTRSTTRPRAAGCSTRRAPPDDRRASSHRRSARRWGRPTAFAALVGGLFGVGEGSVYLCPAPLYHSAPAGWSTTVQRLGGTVVVMHSFDAEACLAAIERHRVTHVQFVPTHLVRILKLDRGRARRSTTSRASR